ncbi:MAG TPA: hypothetical protein PKY82_18090 [Pyrinomonadaceae bacterium]|nr:hypothetical protein [Pyrinomonadaceae bacterium]
MKNLGLRVLVGLVAFGLGVIGVWLLVSEVKFNSYCNQTMSHTREIPGSLISTKQNGKIEIHFKSFNQIDNEVFAEFFAENNTKEMLYYSGYETEENSTDIFTPFSIKVDGKEMDKGWCGTGLITYPIKVGEVKLFKIPAMAFISEWKKGKKLQLGFNFSKSSTRNYQTIWSENLPISGETENFFIQRKEEYEKQIKKF